MRKWCSPAQHKYMSDTDRTVLPHSWFSDDAVKIAPMLLGKIIRKGSCSGMIVETEAYSPDKETNPQKTTPTNSIMRDTYGYWYVRFTYGMHHCVNITTNKNGTGSVLIRAVEPIDGIDVMKKLRGATDEHQLANGPAKFCKAFGIDRRDNATKCSGDLVIYDAQTINSKKIDASKRIGISHDIDLPWRFFIKDSRFLSRRTKR